LIMTLRLAEACDIGILRRICASIEGLHADRKAYAACGSSLRDAKVGKSVRPRSDVIREGLAFILCGDNSTAWHSAERIPK